MRPRVDLDGDGDDETVRQGSSPKNASTSHVTDATLKAVLASSAFNFLCSNQAALAYKQGGPQGERQGAAGPTSG
jgi:hypothetical protein